MNKPSEFKNMENKNSPQHQDTTQQMYNYAAKLLFKQKKTDEETKECLIRSGGLTPEVADHIINDLNTRYKEEEKKAGRSNMLFGALWCIGGIIVTVMTYNASSEGGTYIVAWGAMLFGAIQFIRGLAQVL